MSFISLLHLLLKVVLRFKTIYEDFFTIIVIIAGSQVLRQYSLKEKILY